MPQEKGTSAAEGAVMPDSVGPPPQPEQLLHGSGRRNLLRAYRSG